MIMERFHAVERVNQILFEMGGEDIAKTTVISMVMRGSNHKKEIEKRRSFRRRIRHSQIILSLLLVDVAK